MIIIIVRDLQESTFEVDLNMITLVMDETVNLKSGDPGLISVTLLDISCLTRPLKSLGISDDSCLECKNSQVTHKDLKSNKVCPQHTV